MKGLISMLDPVCDWSCRSSVWVQQRWRVVSNPQHLNKAREQEVLWFIGDINLAGWIDNKSLVLGSWLCSLQRTTEARGNRRSFLGSRYFRGCFQAWCWWVTWWKGYGVPSCQVFHLVKWLSLLRHQSHQVQDQIAQGSTTSRERQHANYSCLI